MTEELNNMIDSEITKRWQRLPSKEIINYVMDGLGEYLCGKNIDNDIIPIRFDAFEYIKAVRYGKKCPDIYDIGRAYFYLCHKSYIDDRAEDALNNAKYD